MRLTDSHSGGAALQPLVRETYRRIGYKYCTDMGIYVRVIDLNEEARMLRESTAWLRIDISSPKEVRDLDPVDVGSLCHDWEQDRELNQIVHSAILSSQLDLPCFQSLIIDGNGVLLRDSSSAH